MPNRHYSWHAVAMYVVKEPKAKRKPTKKPAKKSSKKK